MKTRSMTIALLLIAIAAFFSCESVEMPTEQQADVNSEMISLAKGVKTDCVTIQSGDLYMSDGTPITTGFMENGYNYQAHLYVGNWGFPEWTLIMKWNDAWLSNKDCDGDGLLDRHLGYDSYIGSGAWCTNHWTTTYINEAGDECKYVEFTKIIAVPATATLVDGYWYNEAGVEIGQLIWGSFAIIQEVVNDPCNGTHGVQYGSPDHSGLGNW